MNKVANIGKNQGNKDVVNGIPNLFIVDPKGRLKTEYRRYADGKVVVGNVDRLENLLYSQTYPEYIMLETPKSVLDIDFDHRDTTDWSDWGNYYRKPRVCTLDGKCY